jgi:hypothetical protein
VLLQANHILLLLLLLLLLFLLLYAVSVVQLGKLQLWHPHQKRRPHAASNGDVAH